MNVTKHFSSSILLWMRQDQPRQAGVDHWKGPHSQIIAASPGLEEYRQIHLEAENAGLWPEIDGIETAIPIDRKVDGVAEVTFKSVFSPAQGLKQTNLAFEDEVHVFRRTLLYAGLPGWSRWYNFEAPIQKTTAYLLVYLQRKQGVKAKAFRKFFHKEFIPVLAEIDGLNSIRTQAFLPWNEKTWDTPNVLHDNPKDQRFHASFILGFEHKNSRKAFLKSDVIDDLSSALTPNASKIHAYNVAEILTFVEQGSRLYPY